MKIACENRVKKSRLKMARVNEALRSSKFVVDIEEAGCRGHFIRSADCCTLSAVISRLDSDSSRHAGQGDLGSKL